MASISKPPGSKNYIITFYYNKKKYRRSLKVSTQRDALALKRIVERKLAEGTIDINYILRNQQRITHLTQLIDLWKELIRDRGDIKKATQTGYLYCADLLLEICDDKPLVLINSGYVKDRILFKLNKRYDSLDTIQGKMSVFRNIFSFAERNNIVTKNPFSKMVPTFDPDEPIFFRDEEIKTYLKYWKNPARPKWAQTYFLTLLNTGCRMSEHFNLRWSKNVFLDKRMLKIKGKSRHNKKPKERIVPLNNAALREFSTAQRKLGEDRVFWQVKTTEAVKSIWQRFKENTGFPHRLHDCRANHASQMIMAGDSLEKVMEVHGWTNYKTYKRYKSLSKKYLMENRNIVNWE
jgi:integrase